MSTPPRSETLSNLRNELEAFGETLERTSQRARDLEQRPGVTAQEDMHRALVEIARSIDSAKRSVERALKIVKNT